MGERLPQFLDLLRRWNERIRLTGSTAAADLEQHVAEAHSLLPYLPASGRLVDIGSGGGFPAIVLAIARPDLQLTLVEPIAKKVAFLNTCRRELGLENVSVHRSRDDELDPDLLPFDVATSQATFPPAEWFARARRLVRPGGLILGLLGSRIDLPASIEIVDTSTDDRRRSVAIERLS